MIVFYKVTCVKINFLNGTLNLEKLKLSALPMLTAWYCYTDVSILDG